MKMPLGVKPQCSQCNSSSSIMWSKNDKNEILCSSCQAKPSSPTETKNISPCTTTNTTPTTVISAPTAINNNTENNTNANNNSCNNVAKNHFNLRKSTRTKSLKVKQQFQQKSFAPKGKSRRVIFKKSCARAPAAMSTPITTDAVFYKDIYYQTGDVVSLVDVDGGIYYAQIRGLLQDQYCEKSAVITWLLPTQSTPPGGQFHPATYILGPEEDIPRKLECLEFVCHAPADYFKSTHSPYPTLPTRPETGFFWTRLGPQIKPLQSSTAETAVPVA